QAVVGRRAAARGDCARLRDASGRAVRRRTHRQFGYVDRATHNRPVVRPQSPHGQHPGVGHARSHLGGALRSNSRTRCRPHGELMQVVRFAMRNLWRDLKSGELSVLLLALTVAVLSLTAVGFFTSRISQGVRAQAAEVLAADLRLESPSPIPERYFAEAHARGLRSARILSFPTAIFSGTSSQLAALNAVTASYPLRGHVRIADAPFGVARTTDHIPNRGEVWMDARIIAQLKITLGSP